MSDPQDDLQEAMDAIRRAQSEVDDEWFEGRMDSAWLLLQSAKVSKPVIESRDE